jgi:ribonuclease HIII
LLFYFYGFAGIIGLGTYSGKSMQNFVVQLDLKLKDKLLKELNNQGFEVTQPQYTLFQGKKSGITVTLYTSGKLVVQGKASPEFIEFYLEPELLKNVSFTHPVSNYDTSPRIGVDEAGKGDFFGPLCIAGVYGGEEEIEKLLKMGVKDSKSLGDVEIHRIADKIKQSVPHHVVRIGPAKYNEIYPQFGNLNLLLAWGHATVIEALSTETGCKRALVDQFSKSPLVQNALKRKKLIIEFEQRTKAESDPVVAAASILARDAFVRGIEALGKNYGITLPKGASNAVIQTGVRLMREHGMQIFDAVAKKHFKTLTDITNRT